MRLRAAIAGLATLMACAAPAQAERPRDVAPAYSDEGLRLTGADIEGRYRLPGEPARELDHAAFADWMRAAMSDRTVRDKQGAHGWLAEYLTADGRAFLWYPGNDKVVQGEWRVASVPARLGAASLNIVQVCFRYPGAVNPVERRPADDWECGPAYREIEVAAPDREIRSGDVFALAGGRVPYVLDKSARPEWPNGSAP